MTIVEAVKAAKQGAKIRPVAWQKEWQEKSYAGQCPSYVYAQGMLWRGPKGSGIVHSYTPTMDEITGEWEICEASE